MFNIEDVKVKILGISGSPRKGNTEILVNEALEGSRTVKGVESEFYTFHGKTFRPCIACRSCIRNKSPCVFMHKDDLHEIYKKFIYSDGIILGSPVYHMSVSSQLKAFMDRLGSSVVAVYGFIPRFMKAGGVIVVGMEKFGGQEFTAQAIINHFLIMKCVPVGSDSPPSYIGDLESTDMDSSRGAIRKNKNALKSASNLGKRVAEAAKIIKIGKLSLINELPKEYLLKE